MFSRSQSQSRTKAERTRNLCNLAAAYLEAEVMVGHSRSVEPEAMEGIVRSAEAMLDRIENGPAPELESAAE